MAIITKPSRVSDLQTGTAETLHDSEDPDQIPPRPGRSSQRERDVSKHRKHVTNACQRCRLDKVKCDGSTPCARCVERNLPCTYRSEEDGRSRQHVKRKIEQLEDDCKLLHSLVDTFKSADDAKVAQIISFIRSDASLRQIDHFLAHVQDENTPTQRGVSSERDSVYRTTNGATPHHPLANTGSPHHEPSRSSSTNVLSIDRLVDVPPHEVSAAPWTKVTDDNHLVSHLISLWASWEHTWPDGVVLECFIRDMKQGQLGLLYCSPFLVNSMLAAACPSSDFNEVRTRRGKCSDLMVSFVEEAQHHLQEELESSAIPCVTTVQGLTVLYQATGKMGQKEQSYLYAMQATSMCAELLRTRNTVIQKAKSIEDRKLLSYVIDYTCWGVFCSTTSSLSWWKQPQNLHPPSRAFPEPSGIILRPHSLVWVPYLQKGQEQDGRMSEIMRYFTGLAIIQQDLTIILYAGNVDARRSRNSSFLQSLFRVELQLRDLYNGLPKDIKNCKLMLPSVFQFLWSWHATVMTVLLVQVDNILPKSQTNAIQPEQISSLSYATVTKGLVDSATEVANLARLYRFQFGYGRVSPHVTQALDQATNVLMSHNRNGQYDSDIEETCTFLCTIARRVPFAAAVLSMVTARAKQQYVELPSATSRLLEDFNAENINSW